MERSELIQRDACQVDSLKSQRKSQLNGCIRKKPDQCILHGNSESPLTPPRSRTVTSSATGREINIKVCERSVDRRCPTVKSLLTCREVSAQEVFGNPQIIALRGRITQAGCFSCQDVPNPGGKPQPRKKYLGLRPGCQASRQKDSHLRHYLQTAAHTLANSQEWILSIASGTAQIYWQIARNKYAKNVTSLIIILSESTFSLLRSIRSRLLGACLIFRIY